MVEPTRSCRNPSKRCGVEVEPFETRRKELGLNPSCVVSQPPCHVALKGINKEGVPPRRGAYTIWG